MKILNLALAVVMSTVGFAAQSIIDPSLICNTFLGGSGGNFGSIMKVSAASDPEILAQIKLGEAGYNPFTIAVNPSTNRIYTANTRSNNVSVIDGATNSVVAKVPALEPWGVAVNPTSNLVYTTIYKHVSIINGATNSTVSHIEAGRVTGVAVNPSTNLVYVSHPLDNTVFVFQGDTNVLIAKVPVGNNPCGIAVNPTINRIYTADQSSNTVSVIDGVTNSVVGVVLVGINPISVTVNPTTNRIYAANQSDSTVTVIDGVTNSVVGTVSVGSGPSGISANPTTNRIYAANYNDSTVSVIDGITNSVLGTMPVGTFPQGIAVNPNTNRIYTANGSNTVSVIDGITNSVLGTVPVGREPVDVAVNPSSNRIYTANGGSNTVSVIDGVTNSVICVVPVGINPISVAVNPNTNRIYIANKESDTVTVIDGATNSVVATVSAGSGPSSISVNPTTNQIYTINGNNTVSVIDGIANSVVATVTVGSWVYTVTGITVNPTTNRIYTSNGGDNTVSIIDGVTNRVLDTIRVGRNPASIAVNPFTNHIYTAGSDCTVSVIDGISDNVVATIPVANHLALYDIAVNPTSNRIYTTAKGYAGAGVSIIDGATNNVLVAYFNAFGETWGITVNPITNRIYTANKAQDKVAVIWDPGSGDTTSPSPVTSLLAGNATTSSLTLTWIASGDDGNMGTASQYDIRYSTVTITEANWSSATQCTGEPAPKAAGSSENFTVTGLVPDTTYYFALKVADEVPNWSGISNVPYGITLSVDSVVTFPDANLEDAIRAAISKPTGDIYASELADLTSLDASNRGIVNLTGLEYCTNLTDLVLDHNQISNLAPLADLTNLRHLDLGSNQINNLAPLSGLTNLTGLSLYTNQISNLAPLADLTNLTWLRLDCNQTINNLAPLAGLTNLTYLDPGSNQISDLTPLANLIRLTHLYLYNNKISNLAPLAGLANLADLRLEDNQVTDIAPLVSNTGLGTGDTVDLRGNPLSPTSADVHISALRARGVTVQWDTTIPTEVLSPVTGSLKVIERTNKGDGTDWLFIQRWSSLHTEHGGINGSNDVYAWDVAFPGYPERNSCNGVPVYATAPGFVTAKYADYAGGLYGEILIEHAYGGRKWWSGYLHLDPILVHDNQIVTENTLLGYISNTSEYDTEPHLHFVVYSGSNKSNGLVSFNATIAERTISNAPPPIMTPNHTGTATFSSDIGTITGLTGIEIWPVSGAPRGVTFPHGLFSFNITGITAEPPVVTVRITYPETLPPETQYWKIQNGKWIDGTSLIQSINGNVLTLKLTDGGLGDADGLPPNGTIVDPGGVAIPTTPMPTPTPTPTLPNPLIGTGAPTSHGSSMAGTTITTQPILLPNIQIHSASLSASKVTPGTPVTVTANIANRGTANGSTRIKLYVNGEEDSSQGVTVESGGNRPVYFTINRNQPGTYDVYIGGVEAGSFIVEDAIDANMILFISCTLIAFSLVLEVFYILRRRNNSY